MQPGFLKTELLGFVNQVFFIARCPPGYPINSIKVLKGQNEKYYDKKDIFPYYASHLRFGELFTLMCICQQTV